MFRDGKIFARGASDNGQSLVASLFALRELKDIGLPLPFNVGVSLVADEEFDSKAGVYYLLDHDKFRKKDLVIVEGGSYKGRQISVAEKHLLWIKLTTHGKQVHASNPSKGVNAHKLGIKIALDLDSKLHQKYSRSDPFFVKEHDIHLRNHKERCQRGKHQYNSRDRRDLHGLQSTPRLFNGFDHRVPQIQDQEARNPE